MVMEKICKESNYKKVLPPADWEDWPSSGTPTCIDIKPNWLVESARSFPEHKYKYMSHSVNESISLFIDRLRKEFEDAKTSILNLKDNWDGEGSPSYNESTLDRAFKFLEKQIEAFGNIDLKLNQHQIDKLIDIPEILPGPNGSIDVLWEKVNYELLLNVPSESTKPISYYGLNKGDKQSEIKSKIFSKDFDISLIVWLISQNGNTLLTP